MGTGMGMDVSSTSVLEDLSAAAPHREPRREVSSFMMGHNTSPPPCSGDSDADAARQANNAWKRDLISEAVTPGDTVLDVCCGRGGDLAKCAHAVARSYVGVDIAPGCIAEAEAWYAASTPPVSDMACTLQVADVGMKRLPVDDGSFDMALSMIALHYLADDPNHMR